MKFKLNLQYFSNRDQFDLDSLRSEFLDEYEEPEDDNEPEDDLEGDTPEGDDELPEDDDLESDDPELEPEDDDQELDNEEPPAPPAEKKTQTPEENAAFAALRREKEALAAQAQVLEQVASQYGMTVDEFQKAYKEQQDTQRAKDSGMTLEQLRKQENLESQVTALTRERAMDKFTRQVESTKEKYGVDDSEIEAVYAYIGQNGLYDPSTQVPTIDFEQAYKVVNFDKLMERKTREAQQQSLAKKKARQRNTSLPPTNASTTTNSDDYSEEFDKRIAKLKSNGYL